MIDDLLVSQALYFSRLARPSARGIASLFPIMLGYSLVMKPAEIRALRLRNGWTQVDLAERLGTDPVTVSRWERGKSYPRPSAQVRLSEMKSSLPSEIDRLVRMVGLSQSTKVLRRSLLLSHRLPGRRFVSTPSKRLREVEQSLREQLEMKARVRLKR